MNRGPNVSPLGLALAADEVILILLNERKSVIDSGSRISTGVGGIIMHMQRTSLFLWYVKRSEKYWGRRANLISTVSYWL